MRQMALARKTLRDVRGATIAVAIGNALATFFLLAVYPSYRDSLTSFEVPSYYRGLVGEAGTIATAVGYISAHAFIVVLLLITLAIIDGTRALAGEEEDGTLDLLLAQPVGRARIAQVKLAVLLATLAGATLAIFAGYLFAAALFDIEIGAGNMFAAVVSFIPLVWLFLAISLWGGAALSSRAAATALAVGVVAGAFFLNTIGAMAGILETPRKLSPFYWADPAHVLLHGFDWLRAAGMLFATAVVLALALRSFVRRDVASGTREPSLWSRLLQRLPARRAERRAPEAPAHAAVKPLHTATFPLARKALRDIRGATVGIAVFLAAITLLDVMLFPQYRETLEKTAVPGAFQAFVGEAGTIGSPAGFVGYLLSLFPLLVLVLAVVAGTGALARDEEAGTLDLVLAQPVVRRRLVLERTAGLALALALATLAMLPGFLLGAQLVTIDLDATRVLEALLTTSLLALLVLAVSVWAGATFANRATAATVAGAAVVTAFFLNVLGASVDVLDTPRRFAPFYWADPAHILLDGFDWLRAVGLVLLAALFLALAVWSFQRRDIAGGRGWRWVSFRGARPRTPGRPGDLPSPTLPRPKRPLSPGGVG